MADICTDCLKVALEERRAFHDPDGVHGDPTGSLRAMAIEDVANGTTRCPEHRFGGQLWLARHNPATQELEPIGDEPFERQKMWAISALVDTTVDGWTRTREVPTFYLHPNVQGTLTAEAAIRVATRIVNPTEDPNMRVHITAEEVAV